MATSTTHMRPAVFCYAPEDAAIAREIGDYLNRNTPIQPLFEEGRLRPDFDLIDAAARALSAEIAIVLLSPDSVPKRWERDRWAPVLLDQPREFGSALFFVLVRECKFPDLLRRQDFADLTQDPLEGRRQLKRHLFRKSAWLQAEADLPRCEAAVVPPEALRQEIGDQPGAAAGLDRATAVNFAHACQGEFEGVFWIDAVYRTQAGVLGDTAHALGLRLTGALEQNQDALQRFCSDRRCLFIYENLHVEAPSFGGRSSIITIRPGRARRLRPFDEIVKLYSAWTQRRDECLRYLGDAQTHLLREEWPEVYRLGSALTGLLKHEQRLAEANEVLELLLHNAKLNDDDDAYRRFAWDQSWILGHWGEPYVWKSIVLEPEPVSGQMGFAF